MERTDIKPENAGPRISSTAFADTRPHYELLDGLRGVAALAVVWYHVFEGYAFAGGGNITGINHGYLAVDFFFILSGFVISYAYDDRWRNSWKPLRQGAEPFSLRSFFLRRLIRLHPMVIMGAAIGAVTFCIQGSVRWDGTHVATSAVMLALLCAMFMIPAVPGCSREVRGNGEMFPLNGPSWSLFFEYIGNILYALVIRRMNTGLLAGWVAVLCVALAGFTVFDISGYGSFGVGWTLDNVNFFGGLLRMLVPFSIGMLLSRKFKPLKVSGAFWICSAALLALFFVPYIESPVKADGTACAVCFNGIFESFCILAAFPAILWIGASGMTTDRISGRICKFLGDISFPLYIVHYPFMYLFYSWMIRNRIFTFGETWGIAVCLLLWNILAAWLCLKLYDEPVRRLLRKKYI